MCLTVAPSITSGAGACEGVHSIRSCCSVFTWVGVAVINILYKIKHLSTLGSCNLTELVVRFCKRFVINELQISQFMFIIKNNSSPSNFQNLLIRKRQIHKYNTRSSKSFHLPRIRTKLRQFSIRYQGPMTFNSLGIDTKESTTYSSFTKKLNLSRISSNLNRITDIQYLYILSQLL